MRDYSKTDFEKVFNEVLGSFSKYQLINLCLLAIPTILSGFMVGEYIFSAARLPHRCAIPGCDGDDPEYNQSWLIDAIPTTNSGYDDCRRFPNISSLEDGYCAANYFDRNITISCVSFVYERTNSLVYDFNLECDEWLRALAGTLNSLGGMVALPLAGYISDHYGRRTSIVFFSFNLALTGTVRAFSVNYAMYASLQFLQTAFGGGVFSASYILATELVGTKYRVMTSAFMSSLFATGQVVLGAVASAVPGWRLLNIVLFSPIFLIVSYWWILTESLRWLLTKHKNSEASTTLRRAVKLNGKYVSEESINFLLTAIPQTKVVSDPGPIDKINKNNLVAMVLKSKVMFRRCCTTPILSITTTFIYYGLSINSVSMSGNMYTNYIAIAAIEIPGFWTAVFILDRFGRKPTLFTGYMACGICCIGFAFTPDDMYILSLILFLAGKYFIGLVMTSVYLYTAELYPTAHRHSFLGFSSMLGRLGSVLAPLTPPLMVYWSGIPSMMFGGMALIAAGLVLTQPETLGLKIVNTFEEAEQLGKNVNP